MEKKKLIIGDQIVSYYENKVEGVSPKFIFMHGWGQDGASFSEIFAILEKKEIPFISFDLPGFGASPLQDEEMTIEDYGILIEKCIDKMELENIILIGHSFGGRVAIYLGSYYENIERIILIGSAGIASKMNPLRYIVVKVGKVLFSIPGLQSVGKKVKDQVSSRDYKEAGKMEHIFRNAISNDLQRYMKHIKVPTLMIRGDNDDETPLSEGEVIHKHIKNSHWKVMSGSHFVHKEQPEKVTRLVLEFTHI